MGARFSLRLLLLGCLSLGGCCLSPAGEFVDSGPIADAGVSDAGPIDGGFQENTGPCGNQQDCGCTCICSNGGKGVTYASCIFGFCEDCTPYCYDYCL
jgi:hypothetical protein